MSVRLRLHRADNEEGIALVVSMLVLVVCTIIVAAVLQLATHTAQRSGQTRDRTAAVNAAQAGIQAELSAIADGSCPPTSPPALPGAAVQLPNQTVPAAWYVIQASPAGSCSTGSSTVTIVATGYVSNVTTPSATTTMVAHVNRNQGAPISGGTTNTVRPYDFPDALFTDGTLNATGGTLSVYGSGNAVPNLTANGAITIGSSGNKGSLLGGAVNGQSTVNVTATQIGGPVTGTTVTLTGPSPTNPLIVQGGTSANPNLTNVTVNGPQSLSLLPARPLGVFDNTHQTDIGTTLGIGTSGSPTTTCPSSATSGASNFYDFAGDCSGQGYNPPTYNPPAGGNGITVIIVQGSFTVTVPPTAVGGQLYVIDVGGAGNSDVLTVVGTGSTLPVFAFSDYDLKLTGTLAGQVVAHQVDMTGASTTLTFAPPATPMPDFSFPVGYSAPAFPTGPNSYVGTVTYSYQCPGTNSC